MTLKSVVDVDVNDEKFKDFQALFERYQGMLSKMPGAWASVDKTMKSSFETVAAALLAQGDLNRKAAKAEDDLDKKTKSTGGTWSRMARDSKTFARNVKDATLSITRWVGLGTIFSGLIGAGGLFGLDLLAARAGSGRRSSLGLGVSYGEQRAFSTNYGRVVDPGSYLSGVNVALHDVTKRSLLYGAGLSEGDIRGKDTAQVGALLLEKLKGLADRTPAGLLGQTLQARGLDQLIGLEDFERLKNTPRGELDEYRRTYERDRGAMNLDQGTLRAWQDLDVQLSRAGSKIESAFIRGLDPLIRSGAFTKLSDAIADSIQTLLGSKDLKKWLGELGGGIKSFADYIGSPNFQKDLKTLAADVGAVAKGMENLLKWFHLIPQSDADKKADYDRLHKVISNDSVGVAAAKMLWSWTKKEAGSAGKWMGDQLFGATGAGPRSINNPGNIRPLSGVGYLQFGTLEQGVRGLARQLMIYQTRHHIDTIEGIVNRFAPKGDKNDVEAYIKDLTETTKYDRAQHLDLTTASVLAKVVSAIVKHENKKTRLSPAQVIQIMNNTGGSAVVASNQANK